MSEERHQVGGFTKSTNMFKNLLGRKLEDKLQALRVALRPFTLNVNQDDLHKNRESPGAFPGYLGVIDTALPGKGVAHRKVRGSPEAENGVNELLVLLIFVATFFVFHVVSCLKFPIYGMQLRPFSILGSVAVHCGFVKRCRLPIFHRP